VCVEDARDRVEWRFLKHGRPIPSSWDKGEGDDQPFGLCKKAIVERNSAKKL